MIRDVHKVILEHLPEYTVYIFDEDFKFARALISEKDTFLKGKAPLRGKSLSEVYGIREQKILRPLFKKVLEGEKFEAGVDLNGRNFSARFTPYRDPDGIRYGITYLKPISKMQIPTDISDELEVLFDEAPMAMIFLDGEFRILRANNTFRNTFRKYMYPEPAGLNIEMLPLWKVSNIHNWSGIKDKLKPDESYRNIINLQLSHGTFYYEIQLTPFNGGEGYLLRLKNVTELENMRTELTFTKLRLEQREIFLGKYKDILDRVQMLTGPGEIKESSDFQATLRDTREALQKLVATLNEE